MFVLPSLKKYWHLRWSFAVSHRPLPWDIKKAAAALGMHEDKKRSSASDRRRIRIKNASKEPVGVLEWNEDEVVLVVSNSSGAEAHRLVASVDGTKAWATYLHDVKAEVAYLVQLFVAVVNWAACAEKTIVHESDIFMATDPFWCHVRSWVGDTLCLKDVCYTPEDLIGDARPEPETAPSSLKRARLDADSVPDVSNLGHESHSSESDPRVPVPFVLPPEPSPVYRWIRNRSAGSKRWTADRLNLLADLVEKCAGAQATDVGVDPVVRLLSLTRGTRIADYDLIRLFIFSEETQ
jgi:hypothetical protein